MEKLTPGPWRISDRVKTIGYIPICIVDSESMPIAEVRGFFNGRLIAAAPELIAICKDILEHDGGAYDLEPKQSEKLKQAIAKATGKE